MDLVLSRFDYFRGVVRATDSSDGLFNALGLTGQLSAGVADTGIECLNGVGPGARSSPALPSTPLPKSAPLLRLGSSMSSAVESMASPRPDSSLRAELDAMSRQCSQQRADITRLLDEKAALERESVDNTRSKEIMEAKMVVLQQKIADSQGSVASLTK